MVKTAWQIFLQEQSFAGNVPHAEMAPAAHCQAGFPIVTP
jgi:hypothetical protein